MYVRDARKRDEAWLLDRIEELGLDDATFRSREYVLAVDESTNDRAGFGRLRVHSTEDGEIVELTSLGVPDVWRQQGVGAHVTERLVSTADAQDFDEVYALVDKPTYLAQFGFEPVDRSALPSVIDDRLETKRENALETIGMRLPIDMFEMPPRLRERFADARPHPQEEPVAAEDLAAELAEDFGIDSEKATYKYDTGRR